MDRWILMMLGTKIIPYFAFLHSHTSIISGCGNESPRSFTVILKHAKIYAYATLVLAYHRVANKYDRLWNKGYIFIQRQNLLNTFMNILCKNINQTRSSRESDSLTFKHKNPFSYSSKAIGP